jgi:aspartate-semialdehyde dehydrogenase
MTTPASPPRDRIKVAVLGATGVVGQRFVRRLARHPWFELKHLAASGKSAGLPYSKACDWRLDGEPYAGVGDRVVMPCDPNQAFADFVFSALDSAAARELEPAFAAAGALVFSNASAFRMAEDVPLVIPEVNGAHLGLLDAQHERRGWKGGIVCNPNCTATVLALALAPLQQAFGIEAVLMTSMQATSGAGYPGVASLDILGNVVPYIREEEEKVAEEVPKMLGRFLGDGIEPAKMVVSAHCNRVPVLDGHSESVSVSLRGDPSLEDVRDALAGFRCAATEGLPSAPARPIVVHDAPDRPQPRRDAEFDGGMTVHVGRIRKCPVLGVKFQVLGHNAERGAAGASVLNAELMVRLGGNP